MQKRKLFLALLLVSVICNGTLFISSKSSGAFDGKPPCCVFLPAEFPPKLKMAFKGVQPIEFKLLGNVIKIQGLSMSVSILAIIDKAFVRDVSAKTITIEVSIPEYIAKFSLIPLIKKKDYVLLLPTKKYNKNFKENMYDFVKIPKEMIK